MSTLLTKSWGALALACLSGIATPAAAHETGHYGDRADGLSYILFSAGERSTSMSGSTDDLVRARALRRGQEALLYVRDDSGAYVIRDPETLRRAALIFEPQREMGRRQAALGRQQAALGGQQARLGAQQAGAVPARQAELGRRQAELGREQSALGQRQGALGREQARLAQIARGEFQALVRRAREQNLAEPVR